MPDFVTNSYFPAFAAEELGYYAAEGIEAHVELLAPAPRAITPLRDGEVDVVAAGAHTPLTVFPQWQGAKLVVALAQGAPWLLVMRADIPTPWGGPPGREAVLHRRRTKARRSPTALVDECGARPRPR